MRIPKYNFFLSYYLHLFVLLSVIGFFCLGMYFLYFGGNRFEGYHREKFNIEQNLPVFNNLLNYFLPTEKKNLGLYVSLNRVQLHIRAQYSGATSHNAQQPNRLDHACSCTRVILVTSTIYLRRYLSLPITPSRSSPQPPLL
jgi:hypothetical protein